MGINEKLIFMSKPHWITLIPHVFFMPFFGIGVITFIVALIRLLTTVVAFSDKKVMCKTGLINTHKMDSPLNQVNNVVVANGLLGKIFGYGKIVITTAAGTHAFKGIKAPEKFRKALSEQIQVFEDNRLKKQAEEIAKAMVSAKLQ